VTVVVPPSGLAADHASPQERATFAMPSGDASESALKPADPGEMCVRPRSNAVTVISKSPNWGGGYNVNGTKSSNTFYAAQVRWTQPHFQAVCPGASALSVWSGLGGSNSSNLIQSGSDVSQSSLQGATFWWEMLNSVVDTREVAVSSPSVTAGDYVGTDTRYNGSGNGTATFKMMNFSSGLYQTYSVTRWGTWWPYSFYDGTTSDYISEQPGGGSAPGGRYYLRKPTSPISFPYATANDNAVGSYPSWRVNTTSDTSSGYYYNGYWYKQGSWFDGIHAWTNEWYSCS
jgi:hypothetical protein